MSQNDYVIGNQTAPNFRSDLNDALQALASLSSGSTAPSTTYANMLWYDSDNNILKMRTEADDAWINIAYLDQSANAFRLLDDTQVTNTSGTQTGLLGDQATSAWETGTATTESLVSPAKVKAAIEALVPPSSVYTDAAARAAQAGHSAGGVGSYAFGYDSTFDVAFGGAVSGIVVTSAARSGDWSSANSGGFTGTSVGGTWRCMGYYDASASVGALQNPAFLQGATLWLRIA